MLAVGFWEGGGLVAVRVPIGGDVAHIHRSVARRIDYS